MNKMKKFLCVIMAILMPITAVGCTKQEDGKEVDLNNTDSIVMQDDTYEQNNSTEEISISDIEGQKFIDSSKKNEETTSINSGDQINIKTNGNISGGQGVFEVTTKGQSTPSGSKTDSSESKTISSVKDRMESERAKAPNTNIFFGDRKAYYEFNNSELNNIIDQVKNINYTNSFKIENYINQELNDIKKTGYFRLTKPTYNTNYSWFKNGKIDVDALARTILKNNENKNMSTDDLIKTLANYTAKGISKDYDYLRKNYPSFDTNYMLHTVDYLTVKEIDDEQNVSVYQGTDNYIGYNMSNINSLHTLLQAACHEGYHLSFNKNIISYSNPIYDEALSYDMLLNTNNSMSLDFIQETMIDAMAYSSIGETELIAYQEEYEKLVMISSSTGKSLKEIRKIFVTGDNNALISIFEPELQDFAKAYSILAYANSACGYIRCQGVNNDNSFRRDCFEKFRQLLMQNAYIRVIKNYYYGKCSFDDMLSDVGRCVILCQQPGYNYGSDNTVFDEYHYAYNDIAKSCRKD